MKNIYVLLSFILIASCVGDIQDIPPQINENPIFSADFELGNNPFNISAGSDGIIMDTELGTTNEGVKFNKAILKPNNCNTDCGPSLAFTFYESNDSSSPSQPIDELLALGEKEYHNSSIVNDSVLVKFSVLNENALAGSFWFWNNPANGIEDTNQNTSFVIAKDMRSEFCLSSIDFNDGCITQKCINFKPQDSPSGCNADLEIVQFTDQYYIIGVKTSGEPPYKYDWGQGILSSQILLPRSDTAAKLIALRLTDATGCITHLNQVVIDKPTGPQICEINYDVAVSEVEANPQLPFDKVDISFINSSGNSFESHIANQDINSFFEILEVTAFENSPNGFSTKKVRIMFKAVLQEMNVDMPINIVSKSPVVIAVPF